MTKHWYHILHFTCPLCWHHEEYRERRFDRKPKSFLARHEWQDRYCGCEGY